MAADGITIFWFRRDLRLDDNAGLYHALKTHDQVLPLFIFDRNILDLLPINDARVLYIHNTLTAIKNQLNQLGLDLLVQHDRPTDVFEKLAKKIKIKAVYTNHDYEPYARERDQKMQRWFDDQKIEFKTFKDQVIFEKSEIVKDDK